MRSGISWLGSVYINTDLNELKSSVLSILQQDIAPEIGLNLQIVVCLDGPLNHDVRNYIIDLSKRTYPLVTIVQLRDNVGLALALNEGLKHCLYDYIFRFDTDDVNACHRVSHQLPLLESGDYDVVSGQCIEFKTSDQEYIYAKRRNKKIGNLSLLDFIFSNPINHPTVAFRRSVVSFYGGYEPINFFEDYFLWIKLFSGGIRFHALDKDVVYMRSDDLLSRRSGIKYAFNEICFVWTSRRFPLIFIFFLLLFPIRIFSRVLPVHLQLILRPGSKLYIKNPLL